MIEIIGVDIGLNETTCSFLQSESNRPPIRWRETVQWKAPSAINTLVEAERRISLIADWFVKISSRMAPAINCGMENVNVVFGIETYEYQGEQRRNKFSYHVARLAGVIEGICRAYSRNVFGVSRNSAISDVGCKTGASADQAIRFLVGLPKEFDQHTCAASLVGFSAFLRFRGVSVPVLSSASGSLGTSRARTGAGRSQSAPSSKASSRAKRKTRS